MPQRGDDDPDNLPDANIAYGLVELPYSMPENKGTLIIYHYSFHFVK